MKVKIIENGFRFRVVCEHPEDSTSTRYFTVEYDQDRFGDDEYYEMWLNEVIEILTDRVNHYGYWHEVSIYIQATIRDKLYEEKVN